MAWKDCPGRAEHHWVRTETGARFCGHCWFEEDSLARLMADLLIEVKTEDRAKRNRGPSLTLIYGGKLAAAIRERAKAKE